MHDYLLAVNAICKGPEWRLPSRAELSQNRGCKKRYLLFGKGFNTAVQEEGIKIFRSGEVINFDPNVVNIVLGDVRTCLRESGLTHRRTSAQAEGVSLKIDESMIREARRLFAIPPRGRRPRRRTGLF